MAIGLGEIGHLFFRGALPGEFAPRDMQGLTGGSGGVAGALGLAGGRGGAGSRQFPLPTPVPVKRKGDRKDP